MLAAVYLMINIPKTPFCKCNRVIFSFCFLWITSQIQRGTIILKVRNQKHAPLLFCYLLQSKIELSKGFVSPFWLLKTIFYRVLCSNDMLHSLILHMAHMKLGFKECFRHFFLWCIPFLRPPNTFTMHKPCDLSYLSEICFSLLTSRMTMSNTFR